MMHFIDIMTLVIPPILVLLSPVVYFAARSAFSDKKTSIEHEKLDQPHSLLCKYSNTTARADIYDADNSIISHGKNYAKLFAVSNSFVMKSTMDINIPMMGSEIDSNLQMMATTTDLDHPTNSTVGKIDLIVGIVEERNLKVKMEHVQVRPDLIDTPKKKRVASIQFPMMGSNINTNMMGEELAKLIMQNNDNSKKASLKKKTFPKTKQQG